eukprot:TRINITY_DN7320_c0_g1_i1.p1 TRINITY_DN7320_c0_g1~~TRINITY_DN7320_c0_g1_i1.p1  ORF type:complete len:150 (+),score=26.81 TRINITY_DN7320_c0_g1_i1:32-451(+)
MGAQDNEAVAAAAEAGHVDMVARLLAVPGVDVNAAISPAIAKGKWKVMELVLSYPPAVMSLGLDPVALQSPVARHCKAMELCRICEPLRREVLEGYRLAYSVAVGEDEAGLPIGVTELVCEMAVATRGWLSGQCRCTGS